MSQWVNQSVSLLVCLFKQSVSFGVNEGLFLFSSSDDDIDESLVSWFNHALCNHFAIQSNLHKRLPLHNGHLSTAAIFLADSLDIHSCFHLSTMATFFCAQFGRRREVQMYSFRFVLFLCASHTLLMLDPLWQATELQGQNNSRFVIISVFSDKECKGNHHVIVFEKTVSFKFCFTKEKD